MLLPNRSTLAVLVCCALALLAPRLGSAQQLASIYLEPDHWTYDAIRRLAVAGIAPPASDPALAPITLRGASAVFTFARDSAAARGQPGLADVAALYLKRLEHEYGHGHSAFAGAAIAGGAAASEGAALTGQGLFIGEDRTGAQPLHDEAGPLVAAHAFGFLARRIAWSAEGDYALGHFDLRSGSLNVGVGPFDVWAGRRRLHYGVGRFGTTVLGAGFGSGAAVDGRTVAAIDGLGIHVREPFYFPGFLRVLGPARIEVVGSRMGHNGNIKHPYLVFGRVVGQPFSPRFTIGINRGAIFGGEGKPVTLESLFNLITGLNASGFENQVASVVLRYRPPTGQWPFEAYAEFGSDDTAGALTNVPGVVAGLELGALPGLPELALGIEHTHFGGACCGNPLWYRNTFFRGSWGDDGRVFAHPLGGHGRQWQAFARLDLPRAATHVDLNAFTRRRYSENLFVPGQHGTSWGGSFRVARPVGRGELSVRGSVERGDPWNAYALDARLTWFLH